MMMAAWRACLDLIGFAKEHGLKIGTISDLIAYRRRHDNLVRV